MSTKDFKELTISPDKQVYVVGDIHMKTEPLYKALEALSFDTSKDILVSVGDLIDRGPDAPECILELLNLMILKMIQTLTKLILIFIIQNLKLILTK